MPSGVVPLDRQCGAQKRDGGTCAHAKGWGTDHPGYGTCKLHLGSTSTGKHTAELEAAHKASMMWAQPRATVEVTQLLLEHIRVSAGLTDWYRSRVELVIETDGTDALVQGIQSVQEITGYVADEGGQLRRGRSYRGGETTTVVAPAVNVWLKLYNEERDRCARLCKEAATLGIERRLIERESRLAALIGSAIRRLLDGLDLDAEQIARIPDLARRFLAEIER